MRFCRIYIFIVCFFLFTTLSAQNYQAINGSTYAGSLGVATNPASIVNVPYAWDITPLSFQFKQAANAIKINNYSLLSSPANAKIVVQNGDKKWFAFANQDIHLLNTRINLNSKAAIAFGVNIRNYFFATGSQSNYQDTLQNLASFLTLNNNHVPLSAQAALSSWAELYGTYAQTIVEDDRKIITAGITLKIDRNLAGGYAKAQDLRYTPAHNNNNIPAYLLASGSLAYGYSTNFDTIDSSKNFGANSKTFFERSYSSYSADIGFEYILLADENKGGNDFAYDTKIGVSVMDIGNNKYRYSFRSNIATAGKAGITDTLLQNKFKNVNSIDNFNDSLATVANSFTQLGGDFSIYQPMRLVINVDQHLVNNFFLNAALTIPLAGVVAANSLYIKDMNLVALTPRWETKLLGVYLPVIFNTQKQLWVGGAFKAGPILMGTHNLANLFSKNKTQNGGFYLALTFRPRKRYDKAAHDPSGKVSGKKMRSLQCPSF